MIERPLRALRSLPVLMRAGLGLAALGGLVDVLYHVTTEAAGAGHGPVAMTGHLVTLAGMVVTLVGLATASRRRLAQATHRTKGEAK